MTLLHRAPLRALLAITLLGFTSFHLTLGSLPAWGAAGGAGPATAGLVTTAMLATTVVAQLGVPSLTKRLGPGRTLALGLVALGAPAPALALGTGLPGLVAVSVVRGAGFAVLTVLGAALVAGSAPPARRGEAVGAYGVTIAATSLLATPAGVALTLAGHFAWVAGMAAIAVVAVVPAVALDRDAATLSLGGAGLSAAAARATARPALVLGTVTLAGGGLVTFLPIERPDGQLAAAALLLFGVTAALARYAAGIAVDRSGPAWLAPAAAAAAGLGMLGVAGGLAAGTGPLATAGLLAAAALFGTGFGAVQSFTLLAALAAVEPGGATTASAVWNAAFDAGTAVGAVAVGALAATGAGLPAGYAASALLIAVVLPLTWLNGR